MIPQIARITNTVQCKRSMTEQHTSHQGRIIEYLLKQDIFVTPATPQRTFFDLSSEIPGEIVLWAPKACLSKELVDLSGTHAVSMSLASMAAVQFLSLTDAVNLLDLCAAPGMKSLYAAKMHPHLQLHCNDVSYDRIERMKRLFDAHGVDAVITKSDARFIHTQYPVESFERILVDAPCSGEGVALGGDVKMAAAWSPAKVKRLQQLQIKIVKSAWQLLKPGGRLIYGTCTLNKNENERVIKKTLGITLDVRTEPLSLKTLPLLTHGQAWRILPSTYSIGFFIAVLDKNEQTE